MIKYLIIGANGTLGSEFKQTLPIEEFIATDRSSLDITNVVGLNNFLTTNKPEVVLNCAAYTNVDGAETDYESALNTNANALKPLIEACNKINARLVHFSTGMVFPGEKIQGYTEDEPTQPVNKYGESKLAGEKLITELSDNFYIIRTEWLYGKPLADTAKKSFVEIMISLGKSGKVKGVTDEIGKPTWSKDLANATVDLINSKAPNGIYHLANEGQASRLEWAQEIYKILGMEVELQPVSGKEFPRPAKRSEYELLINTKLPKLRTWQVALQEYLKS